MAQRLRRTTPGRSGAAAYALGEVFSKGRRHRPVAVGRSRRRHQRPSDPLLVQDFAAPRVPVDDRHHAVDGTPRRRCSPSTAPSYDMRAAADLPAAADAHASSTSRWSTGDDDLDARAGRRLGPGWHERPPVRLHAAPGPACRGRLRRRTAGREAGGSLANAGRHTGGPGARRGIASRRVALRA